MCGSNDAPAAPTLPAPPKVEQIKDFFDFVSGTKMITATDPLNPSNKITKLERLPRSKEEEALITLSKEMLQTATENLNGLLFESPGDAVNYAPFVALIDEARQSRDQSIKDLVSNIPNVDQFITDFKTNQNALIDDAYQKNISASEERWAKLGYGEGSTPAVAERTRLTAERDRARREVEASALPYATDLRSRVLANEIEKARTVDALRTGTLKDNEAKLNYLRQQEADHQNLKAREIEMKQKAMSNAASVLAADHAKSSGSVAPSVALNQMAIANKANMDRYNADINRQVNQYRMDVDAFNNQGASPLQAVGSLVGAGAGYYLGGGMQGAQLGSQIGGNAGNLAQGSITKRIYGNY